MVEHTVILDAAISAVEAVDVSLQHVVDAFADHGNIEQMVDKEAGQTTWSQQCY